MITSPLSIPPDHVFPVARGNARLLLQLEGLAACAAGLWGYFFLTDNLAMLAAAVLLPDLAMIAYAFGPRTGARIYNLAHTYVAPATLALAALATGLPLLPLACVWMAHIGLDRALGYGLKHPTSFQETHLRRVGAAPDDQGHR